MPVGDEAAEEIHQEGWHTAMVGVINLGKALELADNRFDHHRFRRNTLSTQGRSRFFLRCLIGVKSRTPKVSRRSSVNACER
jgi:hypothetical protein